MSARASVPRRLYRWLRKRSKRALSHVWLVALKVRNRFARSQVTGTAEVMVSLTTYGSRVSTVAYGIESMAAGRVRPRRLILWLDDPTEFAQRPAALRRLEQRGLEIRMTENYGPHKKYYPALRLAIDDDLPMVTADDDILYPPRWLDNLLTAARAHPAVVSCYRASVIVTAGDRLAPYASWPRCVDSSTSLANLATGVSGVYYPPAMLKALDRRGTVFMEHSPKADDLWLHWVALQEGIGIRQISAIPRHFPYIPGTQGQTLVAENVLQGGNDRRIAALYRPEDVETLSRSIARRGLEPDGAAG
jgi:hypothetical protein